MFFQENDAIKNHNRKSWGKVRSKRKVLEAKKTFLSEKYTRNKNKLKWNPSMDLWSHRFSCYYLSMSSIVSIWMLPTIFGTKVKMDQCLDLVLHCTKNKEAGKCQSIKAYKKQIKVIILCDFHRGYEPVS